MVEFFFWCNQRLNFLILALVLDSFGVIFQKNFVAYSDGWDCRGLNSAHLNPSSSSFLGLEFWF